MPRLSRFRGSRIAGAFACVLVFALAGALGLGPAQAKNVKPQSLALSVDPSSTLTINGLGFGHGHGMSQYGAQGAAKQGLTYDQILDFYYPGTKLAKAKGNIRVLISADTTDDVIVQTRKTLVARETTNTAASWALTALEPTATQFRIKPVGAMNELDYYTDTWHLLGKVDTGLEFVATAGAPITLVLPGGHTAQYRGILRSASPSTGSTKRDTVNVLSLDAYLRGVVPHEMPASWESEALKSQAVAARTYAVFERNENLSRDYQICDSTACQVYDGASGAASSDAAVKATSNQILTYNGAAAFTQFSASNGGWTEAGGEPYLISEQDPYDAFPGWATAVGAGKLERQWPQVGTVTGIQVLARDGDGAWGGRVSKLAIIGTDGTVTVTGDTFRSVFGLRSTLFNLSVDGS